MSDGPEHPIPAIGQAVRRSVGGVDEEIHTVGDAHIKRIVYPPGYRWSTHLKPIVGTELCMHDHVGYLAEGHMRIEYPDGCVIDVTAPHALEIHAGHDAAVIGDETAVLIQFDFDGETASRIGLAPDHDHTWSRGRDRPRQDRGDVVTTTADAERSVADRVDGADWPSVLEQLDAVGVAGVGPVLTATECAALDGLYDDDDRFRSTIDMGQHRFGSGQYRYFDHPLPAVVQELRVAFWRHLLPIARTWAERRDDPSPWPDGFDTWLDECHTAGQVRPTPLLLRYAPGDWNAMHRDLYGELVFPLQVVIGLDRPDVDYTGGEFVVVEQRPRAQSRATVSVIPHGHAMVFATRDRPTRTATAWANAPLRHGVSTVRSGRRTTLGLIFHDAE